MACSLGARPPPPSALQDAGDDQQRQRGGEAAEQRADGEHRHAGHVEALAPEAVGEPAGDGQDDGAGHQVAGEHPGGFFLAGAERAGHVGQGDVGDGGVEHLHEGRQRDRKRDQPGIVFGMPPFHGRVVDPPGRLLLRS